MNDEMDLNQPSTSNRAVESLQPLLSLQPTVDNRISPLLVSLDKDLKYPSEEEDMIKTPSPSHINVSAGTSSVDRSSPPTEGTFEFNPYYAISTTAFEFRSQVFMIIWEETERKWMERFNTSFPYSNDIQFRSKVQLEVGIADDSPDQSLWREMWDINKEYWNFSKIIARLQEKSKQKRVHLWAETGHYHSQDKELWETILDDDTIRREVQWVLNRERRISSLLQFSKKAPSRVESVPRSPKQRALASLFNPIPQRAGTNHGSASDESAASHVSSVASIKDALYWSPPPSFMAGSARKRGSSSSSAEYDSPVTRVRKQKRPTKRTRRQSSSPAGGPEAGATSDTKDQEAEAPREHDRSLGPTHGKRTGQQQLDVLPDILSRSPDLDTDDDLLYKVTYEPNNPSGAGQHKPVVTPGEQSAHEFGLPSSDIIRGQDVCIDTGVSNPVFLPESSERLVLYNTPVSRKMTTPEVVSHLVAHGCRDLTDALNHTTFGQHPVSHGGFSDVYCGHLLDTTQVAVKALRISIQSMAENPKHLKHAARELHTWSKCKHPNVLQLLGFAVFRERIAMVSPWMGQGNLPHYLERTPEANRGILCIQICEGLSYLHEIEIIHGDLKGANVLISEDGTPVLADFGNSTHTAQSMKFTQTTTERSWTMRWSAPELIIGSGPQSKAADVYALAMTIYEIMTGTLPYDGKLEHTIIYMVTTKKEPPERPCTIPISHEGGNELWELLLRCWSFEPEARPSAIETATILKTIKLDGLAIVVSTARSDLD
ncbi:unnamed protein product [Rhizoctonia solani]|uniref:Protein kinase domain-containing protein n=1 Tax=Rhizoctonia solani TaxID=456999 RepID=A0A8H3BC91_9AGAM|nr:unnamed protein product [Rhizoctonia solani]